LDLLRGVSRNWHGKFADWVERVALSCRAKDSQGGIEQNAGLSSLMEQKKNLVNFRVAGVIRDAVQKNIRTVQKKRL